MCLGVSQFWIPNRIRIESNCLNWKHFAVKYARGLWVLSTIVSINYIGFYFIFVWFSISVNLRISLQLIPSTIALLSAALAIMLHPLYLLSLWKHHSIPFQLLSHYYRIVVVQPSVGSVTPQLFLINMLKIISELYSIPFIAYISIAILPLLFVVFCFDFLSST